MAHLAHEVPSTIAIMLPEHLLQYLNEQILCRQTQILQLASLLNPSYPSPHTLIVHGTAATGKTLTIHSLLPALDIPHTIVRVRECITARHLLEKTVLEVRRAVEAQIDAVFSDVDGRCESLGSLAVTLGRMLGDNGLKGQKFVLVLDGIDRLRDSSGITTLIPAIARLGELIPGLTTILVVRSTIPRVLHKSGLPHIHFPPYDRTSTLKILAESPMEIFTAAQVEDMNTKRRLETAEDNVWLWNKYIGVVWDSLGRTAARDVVSLRALCKKLWLPFVSHIRDGSHGTRDFARLVVRTRDVFRDESVLVDSLVFKAPASAIQDDAVKRKTVKASQDLSYYTKHLLLAAFLASYNPSRADQAIFTRLHERKKKKAAARKAPSTTKKDGVIVAATPKHRKISRLLLGPQPFNLERLLAIFHALLPDKAPGGNADVLCQVATLANLRMLIKASSGAGGDGGSIDGTAKWRVNMGWEYVSQLGKKVGVDLADYIVE